jgi:hypothetical protein
VYLLYWYKSTNTDDCGAAVGISHVNDNIRAQSVKKHPYFRGFEWAALVLSLLALLVH